MKKIKFLLLGIVGLLGFGLTQGQFFDLGDNTGSQVIIPDIISGDNATLYNYKLGSSVYLSGVLNTYSNLLESVYACTNSSFDVKGFYNSVMSFGDTGNCSTTGLITSFISNYSVFNNYLYINSTAPISPYSLRTFGDIYSYIYFDLYYLHSNFGTVRDVPLGYTRKKLFLSKAGNYGIVSTNDNDSSFLFTSLTEDSFLFDDLGDGLYNFGLNVYSGFLLLHYNDYSTEYFYKTGARTVLLGLSNNAILVNIYTGYFDTYLEISSHTPIKKGYLTSGYNVSDGYSKFINLLNNNQSIVLTNGGLNQIGFTSYGYSYYRGFFTTKTVTDFEIDEDQSLGNIIDSSIVNNGSNSINSGFLELCLNNLTFGQYNEYLCNKLYNGSNTVLIPGQEGYYLQYGYDSSGNLTFWVTYQEQLQEEMSGVVWQQDTGGNRYYTVPSVVNTGIYSETGLSYYFHNWLENGLFFSCPFHYTDSYYREFKLFGVTHFVPKIGDSFLMPIYCIGAGFREGKNIDFFSGLNFGLDSPLLNDTDHKYLCRLFDLILSVLILFFIIKIYHLLN